MSTLLGQLRRRLFCLPQDAVSFERRGFRGNDPHLRRRLETVGRSFVTGYSLALENSSSPTLDSRLDVVEPELRGFAYEGAAMGLALLERLMPWRTRRIQIFLSGPAAAHAYMIHVGVGWIWARLPFGFRRWQRQLDPLLGWLAFDGWGFHEGFFHWPKYIAGQAPPEKLKNYERRAFDQGLGRSFWFVNGGDAQLIAQTLSNFSIGRQPDLWSGVGLAATYAGITTEDRLQNLRELAGTFRPELAQGAAFAAKARQRAHNSTEYTRLAVGILCGMTAENAARATDAALENLPADAESPAYEVWRRRLQHYFSLTRQLEEAR